jgi:hypothetical protein
MLECGKSLSLGVSCVCRWVCLACCVVVLALAHSMGLTDPSSRRSIFSATAYQHAVVELVHTTAQFITQAQVWHARQSFDCEPSRLHALLDQLCGRFLERRVLPKQRQLLCWAATIYTPNLFRLHVRVIPVVRAPKP